MQEETDVMRYWLAFQAFIPVKYISHIFNKKTVIFGHDIKAVKLEYIETNSKVNERKRHNRG